MGIISILSEKFHEKTLIYTALFAIFISILIVSFIISALIAAALSGLLYLSLYIFDVEVSEYASEVFIPGMVGGTIFFFLLMVFIICFVAFIYLYDHGFASFSLGPSPITKHVKRKLLKRSLTNPLERRDYLRCLFMSDTHARHYEMPLPWKLLKAGEIDVIIHSGDFTYDGLHHEVEDFCKWMREVARYVSHVIIVPGNHDRPLDEEKYEKCWKKWHFDEGKQDPKAMKHLLEHFMDDSPSNCKVHLLVDDFVIIDGIKIYGSPWQPPLMGDSWAYTRPLEELPEKWDQIPEDTDVLVTHGPPKGVLDRMMFSRFQSVGDVHLWKEVVNRVRPQFHCFGHVHETYGVWFGQGKAKGITFLNGSSTDMVYNALHDPILFDIEMKLDNVL